jgi:exopolysaccharide production protein ExoQ
MPPVLALFLTTVGIIVLFRMDRVSFPKRPAALWLPLIYMFILSSRLPSQWLAGATNASVGGYQDGNPIDRYIYLVILLISLRVLSKRPPGLIALIQNYKVLCIFLAYAFLSIAWSDVPFVSLKRWIRDLGIYATIWVVVTDVDMNGAMRLLFRRFSYLALPLSTMLIKYYPELGRGFSGWTGEGFNVGVSTSKNGLGAVALVCALFLVWDCFVNVKKCPDSKRVMAINLGLIGMALWLLSGASSATALLCFVIGLSYLLVVYMTPGRFKPRNLSRAFVIVLLLYFPIDFITGLTEVVIKSLGRETTLTGRTEIWDAVIQEVDNPLMGQGYESFWNGPRLVRLWKKFPFQPNQAHNGYIEVYLNLGLIGVLLAGIVLIALYRDTSIALANGPPFAPLAMAVLILFLPYNYTEAAIKSSIMWYAVLVLTMGAGMVPVTRPVRAASRDALRPEVPGLRTPVRPLGGRQLPAGSPARSQRPQTGRA